MSMTKSPLIFPKNFMWGTATAAHQVEGNDINSDWWYYEQKDPSWIYDERGSGNACGWWDFDSNIVFEDIDRMKYLNNNSHRLSIEWARLETSNNHFNLDVLHKYKDILMYMRKNNIKPMVTLFHFVLPKWIAEEGGWLNSNTIKYFTRFAKFLVSHLHDLCDIWCTLNEPNVYSTQCYFAGRFPPFHHSINKFYCSLKNMLLGHAAAYRVIHSIQPIARVGIAKHMTLFFPGSNGRMDKSVSRILAGAFIKVTLDALSTGDWNPPLQPLTHETLSELPGTLDWIGVNYYDSYAAKFDWKSVSTFGMQIGTRDGVLKGPGEWGELNPTGLLDVLDWVYQVLKVPVFVTENGIPEPLESRKPWWICETLKTIHRAINELNIPVEGYYFWSLIDNWEWCLGFSPDMKFGLYEVDFTTQERKIRRAAEFYRDVCEVGMLSEHMVWQYVQEIPSKTVIASNEPIPEGMQEIRKQRESRKQLVRGRSRTNLIIPKIVVSSVGQARPRKTSMPDAIPVPTVTRFKGPIESTSSDFGGMKHGGYDTDSEDDEIDFEKLKLEQGIEIVSE